MPRVAVLAGGQLGIDLPKNMDIYVGVDAGALAILQEDLPLDYAVGDFDSVSGQEWQRIKEEAQVLVTAQPEKDDTDMELALLTIFERFPEAEVSVYGAFGGRLDHTLANIFLPSNDKLAPFMQQLTLLDEQNIVTYLPAGRHQVSPQKGMAYVAFLPVQDQFLSITGAKYPLDEKNYFFKKVYASNEFIDEPLFVKFHEGYLVIIYSKDRS
ncbi:thiamine diphosphokinase [Streptococcus massiliensis]|uniref:Thiamine diphosphokinase n=1 Tax=Streptococcus massiliensis TaxID=313439 RepID=A0A380L3P7_9STRE|nr:thiamine diphosphokinase [Streptococcus massiliensis]SUN77140.1 thiamine pyrophosphokinase [Streptococcus massiliensis]